MGEETMVGELFDVDLLGSMVGTGYVREVVHADGEHRLFNYTDRAQFDSVWNPVTLQCRGLIVDGGGRVVAGCSVRS